MLFRSACAASGENATVEVDAGSSSGIGAFGGDPGGTIGGMPGYPTGAASGGGGGRPPIIGGGAIGGGAIGGGAIGGGAIGGGAAIAGGGAIGGGTAIAGAGGAGGTGWGPPGLRAAISAAAASGVIAMVEPIVESSSSIGFCPSAVGGRTTTDGPVTAG